METVGGDHEFGEISAFLDPAQNEARPSTTVGPGPALTISAFVMEDDDCGR